VNSRDCAATTSLLKAFSQGDESAREELMFIVYEQLRARARRYLRGERSTVTMQSTALVHEAYVRLVNAGEVDWRASIARELEGKKA
jgi:ECF sigma factor